MLTIIKSSKELHILLAPDQRAPTRVNYSPVAVVNVAELQIVMQYEWVPAERDRLKLEYLPNLSIPPY